MRTNYFGDWIKSGDIKIGCNKCNSVTKAQDGSIINGLECDELVTHPPKKGVTKCNRFEIAKEFVTPVTQLQNELCNKEKDLKLNNISHLDDLLHLLHLLHQKNDETEFHFMSDDEQEFFEERAAIMEYDGGLSKQEAEKLSFELMFLKREKRND